MDDDLEKINLSASYQTMELTLWEILENAQKFHPQKSPALDITLSKNDSKIQLQIAEVSLETHFCQRRFRGLYVGSCRARAVPLIVTFFILTEEKSALRGTPPSGARKN